VDWTFTVSDLRSLQPPYYSEHKIEIPQVTNVGPKITGGTDTRNYSPKSCLVKG